MKKALQISPKCPKAKTKLGNAWPDEENGCQTQAFSLGRLSATASSGVQRLSRLRSPSLLCGWCRDCWVRACLADLDHPDADIAVQPFFVGGEGGRARFQGEGQASPVAQGQADRAGEFPERSGDLRL